MSDSVSSNDTIADGEDVTAGNSSKPSALAVSAAVMDTGQEPSAGSTAASMDEDDSDDDEYETVEEGETDEEEAGSSEDDEDEQEEELDDDDADDGEEDGDDTDSGNIQDDFLPCNTPKSMVMLYTIIISICDRCIKVALML